VVNQRVCGMADYDSDRVFHLEGHPNRLID